MGLHFKFERTLYLAGRMLMFFGNSQDYKTGFINADISSELDFHN